MLVKMASRAIPSSAGSYCFESGIGPHAQQVVVGAGQPDHGRGAFAEGAAQLSKSMSMSRQQLALLGRAHHAFDPKKLATRAPRDERDLVHGGTGVEHHVTRRELDGAFACGCCMRQLPPS